MNYNLVVHGSHGELHYHSIKIWHSKQSPFSQYPMITVVKFHLAQFGGEIFNNSLTWQRKCSGEEVSKVNFNSWKSKSFV